MNVNYTNTGGSGGFKPRTVTETINYTPQQIKERYGADKVIKNSDGTYTWYKKSVFGSGGDSGTVPGSYTKSGIMLGDYYKHYADETANAVAGLKDIAQGAMEQTAQGLQYIQNAIESDGAITGAYDKMNQFADDAYNSAIGMNQNIAAAEGYALDMNLASNNLLGSANELYAMSASDPNSLIGQYIGAIKAIDPDRYVSMAASDVQNSYSNAQGQMQRAMSRQGMSASAQAASLQKNWATALASATAGAKTKARQTGITERLNALKDSVGLANEMQKQAMAEKESSTNIQLNAAEMRVKQSQALTSAGQLTQAAAEGLLNRVEHYNKALGTHLNAVGMMMSAQQGLANFYADQASSWAYRAGSKGITASYGLKSGSYGNEQHALTIK